MPSAQPAQRRERLPIGESYPPIARSWTCAFRDGWACASAQGCRLHGTWVSAPHPYLPRMRRNLPRLCRELPGSRRSAINYQCRHLVTQCHFDAALPRKSNIHVSAEREQPLDLICESTAVALYVRSQTRRCSDPVNRPCAFGTLSTTCAEIRANA